MLILLIGLVGLAFADVVDPDAPKCEPARECGTEEVVSCSSGFSAPVGACDEYRKSDDYRYVCSEGGATVSSDYFCKRGTVRADPPAPAPSHRCATAPNAGALGLGLLLLLVGTRRARST